MTTRSALVALLASAAAFGTVLSVQAQVSEQTLKSLSTPDKVESPIGTLEFKDGGPSPQTVQKAFDALDFNHALGAYLNSYGGASAYALRAGFRSIGADDNSIVVFSELMDSNSLFLTPNADTVYYMGVIDLSKGPMVVEQPPKGVGTINDMWFGWVIDIGFPGPDRGEGGKYLLIPRAMTGRYPTADFSWPGQRQTGCSMLAAVTSSKTIPSPPLTWSRGH